MKKFLTVLLALSVVFTYTVGSAFALPSDESTEAGLASAKAEAIAELNAYDLSDYSASNQAVMRGIIAKAIEDINDAVSVKYGYEKITFPYITTTSVKFACYYNGIYNHNDNDTEWGAATYQLTAVKNIFEDVPADKVTGDNVYRIIENGGVQGILAKAKAALEAYSKTSELEKAREDAIKQFNDYVYLIDRLAVDAKFDDAVEDAKIGCADYADLKAKAVAAINAATDVNAVEKALNTYIEKADKVYALLEEVEVSQAEIDALVKAIRAEASAYKVNSATHSSAVVNAFEAAIEEGVKAAKSVNTWDEYFKVFDKYLGYDDSKAIYEKDDVRVHIKQVSVFKQYANKTKDVERSIKAVKALLADLGEYNWKDYPDTAWEDVENFYYEAAYYVENGQFSEEITDGVACTALKTLVEDVKAADTTNQFNDKVAAAYGDIDELTNLAIYKKTLNIASYNGTTVGGKAVTDLNEYGDNESLVKSLQTLGQNAVNAADSITAADEAYENYAARIDKVNTSAEVKYNENLAKAYTAVDDYVAVNASADLTADQKVFLERFVEDGKIYLATQFVKNPDLSVKPENLALIGGGNTLKDVVAGIPYAKDDATKNGYKFENVTTTDYSSENAGHVNAVISGFDEKTTDTTKTNSWSGFFAAYDKAAKDIDAYLTKTQETYVDAIDAFNTAVAALGAPVYTAAYKSQLDKLDALYTAYTNAKTAFDKLDADEQAEITKTITGVDTFDNAKAEYERLAYLAKNNKVEGSTIPEVAAFIEIATDFVGTTIQDYYSVSGKQEIAQIIDETYTAIEAAATKEAKAEAALKGIEKLDAVAINTRGAQDVADLIAEVKAEAAKYFTKYESASFTSDATTKIDLVKDIIAFNEQFSDSAAAEKAQKIADTKALKIVTSTKLYTKSNKIRVNWRIREGNTASIDGYQVYKSTKAQTGYKFMGKTTKNYMDNKKNLKKGQRFYYKVRAYVDVDGQRYYSDWSNKGNRIYR